MKNRYNFAVVLLAVVLVACGALILGQKVSAAGEGKITGTVKLDGAAPHMRGIDMSKDLIASKPTRPVPPTWKRLWSVQVVDSENVRSLYLRRLQRSGGGIDYRAGIRSKELYVYAACTGDGRQPEIQGYDQ